MAGSNVVQPVTQDPWAPIVLSLDGGGVKGLSSLYILREIMKEIKRLDIDDNNLLESESDGDLLLPCHYFDFIVGTSTGGLIAIMLGRLRMNVNDCIQQYLILSNAIFRPRRLRYVQHYSRRKVQNAAKEVVKKFCGCHGDGDTCNGSEHLRQHDYDERFSGSNLSNETCRVAVLTVREGGTTTFEPKQRGDKLVIFRSYSHRVRNPPGETSPSKEFNPKSLEHAQLQIHEACSATSAAPTYFHPITLQGRKYIDGGVHANNPSVYAWNEATQMAHVPHGQAPLNNQGPGDLNIPAGNRILPHALVSIGTGMSKEYDRFSPKSWFYFVVRNVVDTEKEHVNAKNIVGVAGKTYYRFNVPYESCNPDNSLAEINLAACEKSHKRSWRTRATDRFLGKKPTEPEKSNGRSLAGDRAAEDEALNMGAGEQQKGGFKPSKYNYKTFDAIRDRTLYYCGNEQEYITKCATMLRKHMIERQAREINGIPGPSFTRFRNHPNPNWKKPVGGASITKST